MQRLIGCVFLSTLWMFVGCGDGDGGGNQNNNDNGNQVVQTCGNGQVEGAEECDEGAENSDSRVDACRTDCRVAHCGDGVTDTGEHCDHGPQNSDEVPDACRPDCTPPVCGDHVTDVQAGERCDDGNTTPGDGCNADCIPEYCGNGYQEPGEVCDDGNFAVGDGCSAECQSNESCGNAIVDFAAGESCDDGNLTSHDGCGSDCAGEIPVWAQWWDGWGPRHDHAMAEFSSQKRTVLFGGDVYGYLSGDTWEHDGTRWWPLDLAVAPSARREHAMVYDPVRDRIVLFGGWSDQGAQADTWEFDGDRWALQVPASSPPARYGHALAYDAHRRRVVLFGGRESAVGSRLGDTWEYDGQTWTLVTTGASPAARDGHGVAYDPVLRRVRLFGGETDGGLSAEAWEYDGTSWAPVTTTGTPPSARRDAAVYYDLGHGGVVVFGGLSVSGDGLADLHVLTASDWAEQTIGASGRPAARYGHAMIYSAMGHVGFLVGGRESGDGEPVAGIWYYTPGNFNRLNQELVPPQRHMSHLVWDTHRSRAVLYDGASACCFRTEETWEFDGRTWRQVPTSATAGYRDRAAMVYDETRREVVLFGGWDGGANLDTTATYDGTTWSVLQNTPGPEARHGHAMVWDAQREVVVLFGGQASTLENDTWEWDGASWSPITTANSPSPRRRHGLAYDAVQGRVVLFGGDLGSSTFSNETWEYDGTDWAPVTLTQSPSRRKHLAMTYHGLRNRVVLFGGEEESGFYTDDTWELDREAGLWRAIGTAEAPLARRSAAITYVPDLRAVMLHSGYDGQLFAALSNDTWFYGYDSVLDAERCDNGADDDTDGLVDCGDPDCDGRGCGPGAARCQASSCTCPGGTVETACLDGLDDDCDGDVDCADSDCGAGDGCEATEASCADGQDNDGDGRVDCADPDCGSDTACVAGSCAGWLPTWCGAGHRGTTDGGPGAQADYGCGASNQNGPEAIFRLVASITGTAKVDLLTTANALNLFVLGPASDGTCDPVSGCLGQSVTVNNEQVVFPVTAGGVYYIVVDTATAGSGDEFILGVTCTVPDV